MTPGVHPLVPEVRQVTIRDLTWLMGSLLLVMGPHALRAPWWLTLLTLCLYAWRFHYALTRAPLPSRWLLLGVAAIAMTGVWLEYRTLFGRQAGITLLMLFSGLKLMETRSHRDAAAAAFLGYFLLITNFLYTQSPATAALACVALFALTVTLLGLSAPNRPDWANVRTAGLLLAHAAPAALVLFLLFPRVQGPLWGLPQDAYGAMTGLSETMSPGNLSSLAQSDAIAFRAEFEGQPPAPVLRYWRGPVMWDFDGRTWSMGPVSLDEFAAPAGEHPLHRYHVVLEPNNRNWLFALETPASLPQDARYTSDGQFLARSLVRTRLRYQATAVIGPPIATSERPHELRRALALPEGVNPRATALAREWRSASQSEDQILARAVRFLREGRYTYTLEPPLLGADSVDDFLFVTRAGFCEHFASSFVFLMRAAGVPARVVTGYQGGELNPIDHIVTVRQSDAHAWAEVFLAGRGWLRVDPTAAAAPIRLEGGLARSVRQHEPVPILLRPQMEWLRGVRFQWEAMAHRWNIWVLGYNPERQRALMHSIGMREVDWRSLGATLLTLLGIMTLLLLLWSLRQMTRPDPVQRAWTSFCAKLAERGVERSPSEGPRDYAERAARALPALRRSILQIAALYISLRYGAQATPRRARQLRRLVRSLPLA